MKIFKISLLLFSSSLLFALCTANISNTTSLDIDDGLSACSILKSKYEILKLRLEITEKFGYYVPEIDQKLKALQFKFEKLYKSLKYQLGVDQMHQDVDLSLEHDSDILSSDAMQEGRETSTDVAVAETKAQKILAETDNIYMSPFSVHDDPKVCKKKGNGDAVCYNLEMPKSCAAANDVTCSNNKCRIKVDDFPSFLVSCDGEWIVIQRRLNGSVDFNRNWSDYKNGFGDMDGEFWLGLDKIHALTNALKKPELLIQMEDLDGNKRHAKFDSFLIGGEEKKYVLESLGGYSGDAGNSLQIHKDEKFTTLDSDNDKNGNKNCAQSLLGGWWFYDCDNGRDNSNLNGLYYHGDSASNVMSRNGIKWTTHRGNSFSLKFVQMAIKQRTS